MRRTIILAIALASAWGCDLEAETTKADGGSVSVQSAYSNIVLLNSESTLRREWVAVHDDELPVDLKGTPGVVTEYQSGDYRYKASYSIEVKEPVVAVEVRFILFDIWGETTRALSATDIKDFERGIHALDGTWNLFSANEASEHYASIAYVAAVRTKTGEVYRADSDAVIDAAQEYMSDFTDDLLDEEPPKGND